MKVTKQNLAPSYVSMMEYFWKNIKQFQAINHFYKKLHRCLKLFVNALLHFAPVNELKRVLQ